MTRTQEINEGIQQDAEQALRVLKENGGDLTTLEVARAAFPRMSSRGWDRNLVALRALRRAQSEGLVRQTTDDHGNTLWRVAPRAGVAEFHRRVERELLRYGHTTGRAA